MKHSICTILLPTALTILQLPTNNAVPCPSGGSLGVCGNTSLAAQYDSECTCAVDLCCSKAGFCGPYTNSSYPRSAYCGSGCQPAFGLCDGPTASGTGHQTRNCLEQLTVPCSRPYSTTARVYDANNRSSDFTCYSNCQDGCCFVFDPIKRLNFRSDSAKAGWGVLGVACLLALVGWFVGFVDHGCFSVDSGFWNRFVRRACKVAGNVNTKNASKAWYAPGLPPFAGVHEIPDPAGASLPRLYTVHPNAVQQATTPAFIKPEFISRMEVVDNIKRAMRRWAIGTFGLGAAIATACLLYGGTRDHAYMSGIQLGPALFPFCIYVWITSGVAFILGLGVLVGDAWYFWVSPNKYDMSTGTSASVAALLLTCYLPLIGGWDTRSGIAFTDMPAEQQGFFNNATRYTSLVNASNTLLSLIIGVLMYGQTNIMFGLLAR